MNDAQRMRDVRMALTSLSDRMRELGFDPVLRETRVEFFGQDYAKRRVSIRLDRHPQGWWQVMFGVQMELTYLDDRLVDAIVAVREFVREHDGKM